MALDVEPTPNEDRPLDGDVPIAVPGSGPARRRFLKHGVAGGSVALLVAGKPVKTLAKAYCKFSGWNSVKVKKKKGKKGKSGKGVTLSNAPATCSVKVEPPSYYYKKTTKKGKVTYSAINWPTSQFHGVTIVAGTTSPPATTFNQLFSTSDSLDHYGPDPLLQILWAAPTSVEAYMIAVAFASTKGGFPLSQTYVYDLWANYGNTTAEAESLLTFLQQLV